MLNYCIFSRMLREATPDKCLIWPFGKTFWGYGAVYCDKKQWRVHVRAWHEFYRKPVPKGLNVCHSCDVRLCFNPYHLFIGTQKDNIDDKVQKNRQAKGSNHGGAKLTPDAISEIRQSYPATSSAELADRFGVNLSTIGRIIRREIWADRPHANQRLRRHFRNFIVTCPKCGTQGIPGLFERRPRCPHAGRNKPV